MKTVIREIIVYADKILITYNFTEHPPIKGKNSDSYEDIEMQAQSPAFFLNVSSFMRETFLPHKDASLIRPFFCESSVTYLISLVL